MKKSKIIFRSKKIAVSTLVLFVSIGITGQNNQSFGGNPLGIGNASNTAGGGQCMTSQQGSAPCGSNNTGFGVRALDNVGWTGTNCPNSGNNNTGIGFHAARLTDDGLENTAVGSVALVNNSNGNSNTALGVLAGNIITTGNGNTCLGSRADLSASNLNNASAIGYGAISNASNKIRLGDVNCTDLEGNPAAYVSTSDGRFKSNVTEVDVKGLEFITRLRPVVYNFETRRFQEFLTKNMPEESRVQFLNQDFTAATNIRHSGFIAQEVEKAALEIGYDFDGVHKPKNENENYSLAYSQFVVPLVKAVQQQQQMIDLQSQAIAALEQKLSMATELHANIEVDGFQLGQNIPNPFTNETVVRYSLPRELENAKMVIYDLSGKQIVSYRLERHSDSITLTSQNLSAGIYIYSVIVDGKVLDSKRMIVSEKN